MKNWTHEEAHRITGWLTKLVKGVEGLQGTMGACNSALQSAAIYAQLNNPVEGLGLLTVHLQYEPDTRELLVWAFNAEGTLPEGMRLHLQKKLSGAVYSERVPPAGENHKQSTHVWTLPHRPRFKQRAI